MMKMIFVLYLQKIKLTNDVVENEVVVAISTNFTVLISLVLLCRKNISLSCTMAI